MICLNIAKIGAGFKRIPKVAGGGRVIKYTIDTPVVYICL